MIPVVLTMAGSDSSAGAGIQADLKAISANGGYGASVICAITAQNTRGVTAAMELDLDLIRAQADAVFDDLSVAAVKTGMLASAPVIDTVAKALRDRRPLHYVLDPVMVSKTGFRLLRPEAVEALRELLLPLATLVTPNVHEAEVLTGLKVRTLAQAEAAGGLLVAAGARAVLVKGGHLEERSATDVLVTPEGAQAFPGERIRRAPHPRHRLHLLGRDRDPAGPRPDSRGRDRAGQGVRHRGDSRRASRGAGDRPDRPLLLSPAAGRVRALGGALGRYGPSPVKPVLGRLHVITDTVLQDRFSHVELARLAAFGGADAVQFREKRPWTTRALAETAAAMREALGAVCWWSTTESTWRRRSALAPYTWAATTSTW